MKYVITRSSCGSISEKPHKDAKSEMMIDYIYRACSREILRDEWLYPDWEEYEPYKTGCRKQVERQIWTLEIDDLNRFVKENGKIILNPKDDDYPYPVIEIYDCLRE